MKGLVDIESFLQSHDMSRSDIVPFVTIHTALSALWVTCTWALCYYVATSPHFGISSPTFSTLDKCSLVNSHRISDKIVPKSIFIKLLQVSTQKSISLPSSTFTPRTPNLWTRIASAAQRKVESMVSTLDQQQFQVPWILKLQNRPIDTVQLGVSFLEAKVGRLFLKPITIPGRIWISWKGTLAWKKYKHETS